MTPDADKRAAYVQELREQLSADSAARVEDHLALELMEELLPFITAGEDPPPSLTARLFRFYTDTGDVELAERHRASLHRHAATGDPVALEVLALLSDEAFWRAG